jgi:hypothetical protein
MDVERIINEAWECLPPSHRSLLESVGAAQRLVVWEPLGEAIDGLRRSAGLPGLGQPQRQRLRDAYAAWIPALRLVVVNGAHPELQTLDTPSLEAFLAELAWHEWGHALSIARCSPEDVAAGRRLLERCPPGIREDIRRAGYRTQEYTHEIIAAVYAVMVARQVKGQFGQPPWLSNEIDALFRRVTGWTK